MDLYAKLQMSKGTSLSPVYKQAGQHLNLKEELDKAKHGGTIIIEPHLKNALTSKQRDDLIFSRKSLLYEEQNRFKDLLKQ